MNVEGKRTSRSLDCYCVGSTLKLMKRIAVELIFSMNFFFISVVAERSVEVDKFLRVHVEEAVRRRDGINWIFVSVSFRSCKALDGV